MAPRVRSLESQPVREATIYPGLECMVMGIACGIVDRDRTKAGKNAIGGLKVGQEVWIGGRYAGGLRDCQSSAGNYVVEKDPAAPDVQAVVADVRGLQHRVLHQLTRESDIPLVALRRLEIRVGSVEPSAGPDTGHCVLQARVDAI